VTEVISYGGGRQTVAMCLLVTRGLLPRPDKIVFADTGREVATTVEYLERYVQPHLRDYGLEVEVAGHELATVDLYGHNGDLLLPAFTETGKLQTWCSNEWKAYVVQRHLRAQGIKAATNWIGFSLEERNRVKGFGEKPWLKSFPLIDLMLTSANCEKIITDRGWPIPEKSRCFMCPHQTNEQWRQLRQDAPEQFAEAVRIDDDISSTNDRGALFLHHSRVRLADADLEAVDRVPTEGQACGFGGCWV
jgi:hypothetical protein